MKKSIQYGSSIIKYDLAFSDRKTMGIKVHPDKRVEVTAPIDSTQDRIHEKLKSKANWILKQQEYFISFHPLTSSRKYISGETHLYLGKQYRLKLIKSKEESVKLYGGYINVYCKGKVNTERISELINDWYQAKAELHFHQVFENWRKLMKSTSNTNLRLKWMKKRWGSCNRNGIITLNLELIKAPKKCIEYVIVHELCHLSYLNHSKSFYRLLDKHYPNWRETKYQLEHFMA